MKRIATFEEFWPFYLGEHSKPATRAWHFVGSTISLFVLVGTIATGHAMWALLAPVPGYAFAWYSHFFIEHNRPATFTYPLWSFIGDWKMWAFMLTGKIGSELDRHAIRPAA